jgi:hypothetical protein
MPKKAFGADMKLVEVKFLKWFVVGRLVNRMNTRKRKVRGRRRIRGRGRRHRRMGRQDERGGITEATGEDAMDGDAFRATERIVSNKREETSFVEFLKSGSRDAMLRHKAGNGTG